MLEALTVGAFYELVATMPIAWLGDRLGRIRVFIDGLVAMGLLGIPLFLVVSNDSVLLIFVVFAVMRFASGATYAPRAAIMAQTFGPNARYTSTSLTYQVSGATGTVWSVIGFLLAMCVPSIACATAAPQHRDLDPVGDVR